jgi:hypothetical protein
MPPPRGPPPAPQAAWETRRLSLIRPDPESRSPSQAALETLKAIQGMSTDMQDGVPASGPLPVHLAYIWQKDPRHEQRTETHKMLHDLVSVCFFGR